MIVSATVSDPQYISAESDFLLSENRINVSLTRHRDKLVVIVPESLLGFIPADKDLYDDARIWKLLSRVSGEALPQDTERLVWNGTLADIASSNILEDDLLSDERQTVLNVYSAKAVK